MKTCNDCGEAKTLEDFHKHERTRDRRFGHCKACHLVRVNRWHRENPERTAAISRRESLKHTYKWTWDELQDLYRYQKGLCGLCELPMRGLERTGDRRKTTNVDHDHACCSGGKSCGKCVRALVHPQCNTVLSLVERYPLSVAGVSAYLDR